MNELLFYDIMVSGESVIIEMKDKQPLKNGWYYGNYQ